MKSSEKDQVSFSTEFFKVRSYEVRENGKVTISSVCNYFQEAAGLHAKELNFDISDLMKQGLTWILYRLHVQVDRFPERWEKVSVRTWPSAGAGIRAFRDYELLDKNGKQIARGLSQWMMLDITKKRPVKITPDVLKFGEHGLDHVLPENNSEIKQVENVKSELVATAGLNDLDMNGHVNNVKYIDWSTGFSDMNNKSPKKCREIFIQYTREANAGDRVYLKQKRSEKPGVYYHTLYTNGDLQLSKAETRWA